MTNYTTRLQTPILLSGEWECALCEFTCPATWYTFPKGANKMQIKFGVDPEGAIANIHIEFHLTAGYYATVGQLINAINSRIETQISAHDTAKRFPRPTWPKFSYSSTSRRVTATLGPYVSIYLEVPVAQILGFGEQRRLYGDTRGAIFIGPNVSDIRSLMQHMYLYCDVVENIVVGDSQAPLLRIIDVTTSDPNDNVHHSFETPRYIPVRVKNFDSIEIDIRDDLGEPVPFESGKLVATLHFRQSTNSYFL